MVKDRYRPCKENRAMAIDPDDLMRMLIRHFQHSKFNIESSFDLKPGYVTDMEHSAVIPKMVKDRYRPRKNCARNGY